MSRNTEGAVTAAFYGFVEHAQTEGDSGNAGFSSAVSFVMPVSGELRYDAFCQGGLVRCPCILSGRLARCTMYSVSAVWYGAPCILSGRFGTLHHAFCQGGLHGAPCILSGWVGTVQHAF
jgi:hypothetical protein